MGVAKFVLKPSRLSLAALELARAAIGVTEKPIGSNNGPEVKKYLAAVGLPPGYAWCMAFVYYMVEAAAAGGEVPIVKTGGVLHGYNNAKGKRIYKLDSQKQAIEPSQLLPGDIFIMQFKGGQGHTGFVDKVSGSSIITIEGNTDKGGGREGIGVFSKRRKISELRGIIRILDAPVAHNSADKNFTQTIHTV